MKGLRRGFLTFGLVGVVGFLVDSAVLYAALTATLDPYSARVVSYFCAATATWALNRRITFADRRRNGSLFRQWLLFLATNAVGGAVNYAIYSLVVFLGHDHALLPLAGLAAGSVAGWGINYALSHKFVFRKE